MASKKTVSDPRKSLAAAGSLRSVAAAGADPAIDKLRTRIDTVDRRLLALLSERGKLVEQVGKRKRKLGLTFHQPGRERAVLDRMVAANEGPYPDEAVEGVFREVMSASLALESPLTIAAGDADSIAAARRRFGSAARLSKEAGPAEALDAVSRGFAAYAVVSVEDGKGGFRGPALDALADSGLAVTGEIVVTAAGVATRSLVVGGDEPGPSGDDLTSTVVVPRDEPGAIAGVLSVFGRHGVNLRRLSAGPARASVRSKRAGWSYQFFVDLEGHRDDASLSNALAALAKGGALVRVLGSYPRGRSR